MDDAEYDLESAQVMLRSGRRFFVVFMCHLTVEKSLKAVIIERLGVEPPRIHSLEALAQRGLPAVPEPHGDLIAELDDMGVVTRYPDGRQALSATLTNERVTLVYNMTVSFLKWIREELS